MYISIKLPPAFGAFNRIRKENYPFSTLFTMYLATVSRLGLALGADIDELVGYIEDRVFDGERLPDIPEGDEQVAMRYKTDDPDVIRYIGQSRFTNRMAVMYIARMTLRLSAAYGNSLFRLTKLIADLDEPGVKKAEPKKAEPKPKAEPKAEPRAEPKPRVQEPEPQEPGQDEAMPMPKVRIRQATSEPPAVQVPESSKSTEAAEAAKAALAELNGLTEAASGQDIVETNPFLSQFL